jgi:uncharacterized protein YjdB
LAGYNNATIKNSVAANGSISATAGSTTNRIAGQDSSGTYQKNYANGDMMVNGERKSNDTTVNGTSKTLDNLKVAEFYTTEGLWYNNTAWDFDNVWTIDEGNSLPVFKWQSEGIHVNGGALLTAESDIETVITAALNTNTTVTVTGKLTGVTAMITLEIPAGKKVVWQADYSGTPDFELIDVTGDGSFEVAGGKLKNNKNSASVAAIALYGNAATTLYVTSGEVTATDGWAILVTGQDKRVFITGGTISSSNPYHVIYFFYTANNGVLFQSGGTVEFNTNNAGSTIGFDSASNAFAIQWDGTGTEFDYGDTAGLTVSSASATAKWVLMNGKSGISYENEENKGFIEVAGVTVTPDTTALKVTKVTITNSASAYTYKEADAVHGLQHSVKIEPANATVKDVSWTSSDKAIAIVNKAGLVTFTGKEGTVRITAASADGPSHYKDIKVSRNVTKIRTPLTTVNITKGKKLSLPIEFDDGKVSVTKAAGTTFKSSNTKVVTVDPNTGVIKGVKKGSAKITVMAASGKSLTVKVNVGAKAVKLKTFTLTGVKKNAITIKAGNTKDLKIKLTESKASDLKVTFGSSKSSVAKVDAAGRITALKKGTATITVKAGGKTVKVALTVK